MKNGCERLSISPVPIHDESLTLTLLAVSLIISREDREDTRLDYILSSKKALF